MIEDPLLMVAARAVADKRFWERLKANLEGTLHEEGITLSAKDIAALRSLMVREELPWNLDEVMDCLHKNLEAPVASRWTRRWPDWE